MILQSEATAKLCAWYDAHRPCAAGWSPVVLVLVRAIFSLPLDARRAFDAAWGHERSAVERYPLASQILRRVRGLGPDLGPFFAFAYGYACVAHREHVRDHRPDRADQDCPFCARVLPRELLS